MQAVSSALFKTIIELQALPSLSMFALAGGTNLALRFNHRISEDIDLFSTSIVGFKGFESIAAEVKSFYGDQVLNMSYPVRENDQFVFLRFLIVKDDVTIKVDIIHNMKALYPFETYKKIKCYDVNDIGLFKLVSCANRPAKKDIYDLEYITDSIQLLDLYNLLKEKKYKFNKPNDRNIFDLDKAPDPIDDPYTLLKFDKTKFKNSRHFHAHDNIKVATNAKSWVEARIYWRQKVKVLYAKLDIPYKSK
ncbi:nucleotidyl transferase AbiEii/AbiGii toxin family protein [Psychroflexus sp. ALD_RP9]|uniref:nucleotidyl transferase AbiEii/AbiGii toxin family protein n=1 Tax=Psychroflexus sp. ALD_RP9 TaxID=2777186 RepID=UPI001A8E4D84|nr:nucleotidyl transferase AbiEii/AbiGii toxin family protein [Psychroflexus sp. ALD_RP9]QSS96344.1 nucleotidyl transferase AbiEii/AbiGii toxin family protein [Psychroflexus sp. ALD_RP9]